MNKKNKSGLYALIILFIGITLCSARDVNIVKFIDEAVIRYETGFTVNTTLVIWNRMLDNPCLMGKLWELYEFSPAYKISRKGSEFHIIDPTGIEGNLYLILSSSTGRIYYGTGSMKNWGLPVTLRGKTLFRLHNISSHDNVTVTLHIYGEGGDTLITDLLLKAVSPILRMYINRRITRNLRDLKIIIADMMNNPDKIRTGLSGETLKNFNQILNQKS